MTINKSTDKKEKPQREKDLRKDKGERGHGELAVGGWLSTKLGCQRNKILSPLEQNAVKGIGQVRADREGDNQKQSKPDWRNND